MWAVLSKEEVPHLLIESRVISPGDDPCGLLILTPEDLGRGLPLRHYTSLSIHVLPADVAWLDRLAEAAKQLAAEIRWEVTKSEIDAQMRAEDAEAARLAEKARVADPGYVPTLAEAMRNPAELVAGMIEEGPVRHTSLPLGLEMYYGDGATCRTSIADDTPPAAPEWRPEDYARCLAPDIGKRLTVGRVYQVEAVHPVVVTGQPDHPPMLRLQGVEGGPFLADHFERCDVPF